MNICFISQNGHRGKVHRSFPNCRTEFACMQIALNADHYSFQDWLQSNKENYAKSFINIEKMNEINSKTKELDIRSIDYPKIDGSCLVLTSELIKSGVNLPHSLLLYGDDSSIGTMAKLILGDKFIQFTVKNILKVHARRHPKKRLYIKDENNPRGFCGKHKGEWSDILDKFSKHNLHTLIGCQNKFYTFDDVFKKIK